jgi:hypothetical protein
MDKKYCGLCIGLAIAAVVLLRVERGYSREASTHSAGEELRFLCIGPAAVEIGSDRSRRFDHELRLVLPLRHARAACRPPDIPNLGGKPAISVTAPHRGYGVVFERHPHAPGQTLKRAGKALVRLGWRETGGSDAMRAGGRYRAVAAYQREGGWLLAAAVSDADDLGSFLLLAGEWAPAAWGR